MHRRVGSPVTVSEGASIVIVSEAMRSIAQSNDHANPCTAPWWFDYAPDGASLTMTSRHHRSSAATPGSVLPSRNSSVAPPPVETWVIASAKPSS